MPWRALSIGGLLLFTAWFLIAGALRPGYESMRHAISLLSLGPGGGFNVLGISVCAVSLLAAAVVLRQIIPADGPGRSAPRWIAAAGFAFLLLAAFPDDPGLGYPPGAEPAQSVSGLIHGLAGTFAFAALSVTCFAAARWHRAKNRPRWAGFSRICGAVVALGYIGTAVLTGLAQAGVWPEAPGGLVQRITVVTAFLWVVRTVSTVGATRPATTPRDGATQHA